MSRLQCAGRWLDLSRPRIMGILNVTPDSFSDGGQWLGTGPALEHARQMLMQGADIIDVGGESTRPGAQPVSISEELDRVMPVVQALRQDHPEALISVDTSKPEVMRAALAAGVHMINDVRALQLEGALEAVQKSNCAVCLMHMQGTPSTMQARPRYDDVVAEVRDFLQARINACRLIGIESERLCIDPGFGFGKSLRDNVQLLAQLHELLACDRPLLVGISRKSMLAAILDQYRPAAQETGHMQLQLPKPEHCINAGTAAALLAVQRGAAIVRTHDVKSVHDALAVWLALTKALTKVQVDVDT